MNLDRFETAARHAFAFLEHELGLAHVPESPQDRRRYGWVRYVTYRDDRVFVRVELDNRDRVFNVLFGPVRETGLPPYPIFLERDDEPIEWFPLWALLRARRVPEPPFSFVEDERLDAELAAWAETLRTYAAEGLRGEFADLEDPVRRVKREELADVTTKEEARVIQEGVEAPDFELTADDGSTVRLSKLRGKSVVVYFYPRDDTPGCTAQACAFRDVYGELEAKGAVVLGVSRDDEASHRRFKEKYGLPFTLLSDLDGDVVERYGVWREKKNYGKTYMGIHRSTFVIGPDGTVAKAMYGVKPDTDAERVLEALSDG